MTTEERLDSLVGELARATRRSNRLLLGFGVVTFVMACALGYLAAAGRYNEAQADGPKTAAVQSEIRARSFVLEDESGKTRAALYMKPDGPRLNLRDENGKDRVGLGISNDGPWVNLKDENGKERVALIIIENEPSLTLFDETETARAQLASVKDGPSLSLIGEAGENGKHGGAELGVGKKGPALGLFGKDGKGSVEAGVGNNGARLDLFDDKSADRVALFASNSKGEAGMGVFDESGKLGWSTPVGTMNISVEVKFNSP